MSAATPPAPEDTAPPWPRRRLVHACFFLSGATSLVYEVVWMRQLLLTVGSTAAAVSIVLASFMAGLAGGARAFGGAADRSRRPLRLYALLEAGVAAYALAMPWLVRATRPWYVGLAQDLAGSPGLLMFARLCLAALLLAVPTVLMGATFPVLLRYVTAHGRLGSSLGRLYGVNLAGAVAGSLAGGFVLIRAVGLQGATWAAVAVNLTVAAAAFAGSREEEAAPEAAPAAEAAGPDRELPRGLLWTTLFFSGFVSLACEVLWSRILVLSLNSTVYSFTIILATFLVGLAVGSHVFSLLDRKGRAGSLLGIVQIASGLSALLLLPLSARFHELITGLSTRFGYTGGVFLAATVLTAALLVLVPATFMGFVFPLATAQLAADRSRAGRTAGDAYLVNTAGSVAGSLMAAFVLVPALALAGTLALLSGIQVVLGWAALLRGGTGPRVRRTAAAGTVLGAGAALVLLATVLRGANPFDPASYASPPAVFEAHRDGNSASVSVLLRSDGSRSLRIDGFEATTDHRGAGYMAMMSHLPLMLHPDAHRVLVICFGTGTTASAALLHPGTRADVVDIEPVVFEFAPLFARANRGIAADPRARLLVDDGRNYLLTTREQYDVITSEPMPPNFAGVVNLYAREYYELARERLRPGGIVTQWLPLHLVTTQEAREILRTVQSVFPETTLWVHGGTGIVVARRDAPLAIDLGALRERYRIADVARDLRALDVPSPDDFISLHILGPAGVRSFSAGAAVITDDRPSLEFHAFRHKTSPQIGMYRAQQLDSLEPLYRARLEDAPQVVGATAEEAAALDRRRRIFSHIQLAHVHRAQRRPADALRELNEAMALASEPPVRAWAFLQLARLARFEGRIPEAGELLQQSLELEPGAPEALRMRDELARTSAGG